MVLKMREEIICFKCGKKITNKNLGGEIESEERLVCQKCYNKHIFNVITELNKFRINRDFDERGILIKKILWISEQMGNWHDAGDKSYIENVSDYTNSNLFELQCNLLDKLQVLIGDYIHPKGIGEDYEEEVLKNLTLETLRIEIRKQQEKISTYY
jgi:DNA-directed RNA polymerase subunit RPC12/RpoP